MKHVFYAPGKKNPHLPHDGLELESAPPADACDDETAERNADVLVSQMMLGHSVKPRRVTKISKGDVPADVLLKAAQNLDDAAEAEKKVASGKVETQKAETKPTPEAKTAPKAKAKPAPKTAEPKATVAAKSAEAPQEQTAPELKTDAPDNVNESIRQAFQPLETEVLEADPEETLSLKDRFPPVYAVGLGVVILSVIWPMAMVMLVVFGGSAFVLLMAALKLPGVSLRLARRWHSYAKRRPKSAERMRRRADRLAMAFDRVLDLLPSSLADRLALPDFSEPVSRKR